MASRHLAPFFALLISMNSLFMPSNSYAMNGTTTAEASADGSENFLTGEFGVYLATFAALLTAKIIDEGRKIVGQKDFARNLGMKIVEFGRGIKFACRRPDQIKQMLSDQMTQDMRRILETAMNQGLKKQAYDGDQSKKFTPGYFGADNEFFAWQNVFPSTLVKDEKAPGLLIYSPADPGDFVGEEELTPVDDREINAQHQGIIRQLLNQILPPEDKKSPLLKSSLEILGRVFTSGAFRVASYYGEDERKTKGLKKVPNGVQVLRILNPSDREGYYIDLLGTLIYFPDLGQRTMDKVDILQPLLSKPASVTVTEWKKTLPSRIKWFLKEKRSYFLSGSRKIEQRKFTGPITYRYSERESEAFVDKPQARSQINLENEIQKLEQQCWELEITKREEMARIHEMHRIKLEALKRELDQRQSQTDHWYRTTTPVGLERARPISPESILNPRGRFHVSRSFERHSHERQGCSLARSISPPIVVRTMTEDSSMLSRRNSRSLSDMRLQTACGYYPRMARQEISANWESQVASRSPSPLDMLPQVAYGYYPRMARQETSAAMPQMCKPSSRQAEEMPMTAAMQHDWSPSSDRFCEQMLDEEIAYASREAVACRQSSQQAAEMARESRGMAEERPCSPGYSDIDFSDEEPEDYPLGNTGSSRLADEERLTSVLVTWEL